VFFHISLVHFVLILLAFVVLGLVSSVLCQEIVLAGKNVSEMSILCRVGRKTLTQSKVDVVRAAGKKLN